MLCLMQNQKAYKRPMAETDEALTSGKIPKGQGEVISDTQAKQMPYLQQAQVGNICCVVKGVNVPLVLRK